MKAIGQIAIVGIVIAAFLQIGGCAVSTSPSRNDDSNAGERPLGNGLAALADSAAVSQNMCEDLQSPTDELSRSQAIRLVLLQNPELRSFSWDIRIADARRLHAGLRPNPELELEIEEVGGTGDRSGFHGAETTLAVRQPIELAGKRAKRVKLADANKRLSQWDYEAKVLDVYARADKAFARVLAAQERVQLVRRQVELAEKLSTAVDKRVEAGKDSPLESVKAQVELSCSRIELTGALAEVDAAKRQLASLWAADRPEFTQAVGRLDDIVSPDSYEALRDLALKHPRVSRWDDELSAAKASLELARAQRTPNVSILGGLKRLEDADDNTLVLGLAIPLPVFDRNQAGLLEAVYVVAKARELAREARAQVIGQLAEAHGRLTTAAHKATTLRGAILPKAEQAFEAALAGYQQGKFDYLSVLDSQRTLFDVRQQIISAILEYHEARVDVERLIGRSLESLNGQTEAKNQVGANYHGE